MTHFKTFLSSTAIAAALLSTGAAFAETDLGNGFTADGSVDLSYIDLGSGSDGEALLFTDSELSWTTGTFGFDVGVVGGASSGGGEAAFFGGFTYTFGNGDKLTLGAPRAAFDEHAQFKLGELSTFVRIMPFISGNSLITSAQLLSDDLVVYGVRYDGAAGALDYAISLHQEEDGQASAFSSSASYAMGTGAVSGGLEYIDIDGVDAITEVKLRYDGRANQFGYGAGVMSISSGGSSEEVYEIYGSYLPNDQLELTATATFLGSGGDAIYGLGASYAFNENTKLRASAMSSNDFSDAAYEVGVRFEF